MTNLTKGERFLERSCKRPEGKPIDVLVMLLAVFALFLLSLFVHSYVEPKTIHAADMINDIHTREAACDYLSLYPEKITDMKQYKKNCL